MTACVPNHPGKLGQGPDNLTRQAISRLENGPDDNPTLDTPYRYARTNDVLPVDRRGTQLGTEGIWATNL